MKLNEQHEDRLLREATDFTLDCVQNMALTISQDQILGQLGFAYHKSFFNDDGSAADLDNTEARLERIKTEITNGLMEFYKSSVGNPQPRSADPISVEDVLLFHPLHLLAHALDDSGEGFSWEKCPHEMLTIEACPPEVIAEVNRRHGANYYPHIHSDPELCATEFSYEKSHTNLIKVPFSEAHERLHRQDHNNYIKGFPARDSQLAEQIANGATLNEAGGAVDPEFINHVLSHHGGRWDGHALSVPMIKAQFSSTHAEAAAGAEWDWEEAIPFLKASTSWGNVGSEAGGVVGAGLANVGGKVLSALPFAPAKIAGAALQSPIGQAGASALFSHWGGKAGDWLHGIVHGTPDAPETQPGQQEAPHQTVLRVIKNVMKPLMPSIPPVPTPDGQGNPPGHQDQPWTGGPITTTQPPKPTPPPGTIAYARALDPSQGDPSQDQSQPAPDGPPAGGAMPTDPQAQGAPGGQPIDQLAQQIVQVLPQILSQMPPGTDPMQAIQQICTQIGVPPEAAQELASKVSEMMGSGAGAPGAGAPPAPGADPSAGGMAPGQPPVPPSIPLQKSFTNPQWRTPIEGMTSVRAVANISSFNDKESGLGSCLRDFLKR